MRRTTDRELVRQGLPMVQAVVHRLARRLGGHVNIDDLLGLGHLALLEIARTHDPGRASFATYAAGKLKWAILDGLRRETHGRSASARLLAVMAAERYGEGAEPEGDEPTTQEEDQAALALFLEGQAMAMALSLMASPPDTDPAEPRSESPEDKLSRAQFVKATRVAVKLLPERERTLIERHYYGGDLFDVIATDLGISKSWASRLHDRAIDQLRVMLLASLEAAQPEPPEDPVDGAGVTGAGAPSRKGRSRRG